MSAGRESLGYNIRCLQCPCVLQGVASHYSPFFDHCACYPQSPSIGSSYISSLSCSRPTILILTANAIMLRKIIILSWAAVFCVRACGQPPLKQAVHHPHLHLKGAAYTNVTASSAAAAAGTQVSAYSSAPASILSSGAVVASSSSGSSSLTLISTSSAVSPASISTSITAAASSSSLSAYSSSAAAAPVSSSSSTESASSAAPSSTTSSPSPTPSSSTTPAHSSSAAPVSGGTKPKALPYNDGISYSASFTQ